MGYTLVAAVLCLAILRLSEGLAPVFTDGATQSTNLAENTAAGASAFSLTTTTTASFYSLGGADAASFDVTPLSGTGAITAEVTIKASPVFATKPTYSVTVIAADATSAPDTATATVTINVIKTPAFTATTFTVTPCDGATATTEVATATLLTATGHTGRTFLYAIASGNILADFAISSTTGQITVATSKTLVKATTATYKLVITAGDPTAPAQTGTTTVTVNVGCSGSAAITGSMAALLCMIFSIIQKLA